ncbi:MAG: GntR family transcriptional regulator [Phycisphaerae bacterium]|nr:GntR family transcriptional regulator [Phycisphaerae bacterium]
MPKTLKKKTRSKSRVSRHVVREAIQQKILRGEYAPGTRLGQVQLSKEFDVSQSVVRESLLELRAMGMVELKDQLGAFVREVDTNRLQQVYMIREVLEGLAARMCCEHISRGELRELERLVKRIEALTPSQNEDHVRLDREFHQRILHLSRCDMLIQLAESYQILGKVLKVRDEQDFKPDRHFFLLEPIRKNQPDEAERRMREHIRNGWREMEEKINAGTFKLQWIE